MYLLLVYNDYDRRDLMFIGQFKMMKDISDFTNGLIRYCDRIERDKKCYRTYKNLFKVVKIKKPLFNNPNLYLRKTDYKKN